jgi:hypothetical protein
VLENGLKNDIFEFFQPVGGKGAIMHPWPFKIDMITFIYLVVAYAGFLTWGILLYLIILWKFKDIKTGEADAAKRRKGEKILKFMNYLLYFLIFQLIISSVDVLLMTVGIFNPARLPYKAINMASANIPIYFLAMFIRFRIRSKLNLQSAES